MKESRIYHCDCITLLKSLPDKSVDWVITDPPYGLNMFTGTLIGDYSPVEWDKSAPSREYFDEIIRVSKNQAIFGAEYLCKNLPQSRGWIIWDKQLSDGLSFGDTELCWTSRNKANKIIRSKWSGFNKEIKQSRIHPTEKPVVMLQRLFDILEVKETDTVLDCFAGSGSTLMVCKSRGIQFIGVEKEKEYYDGIKERMKQTNINETPMIIKYIENEEITAELKQEFGEEEINNKIKEYDGLISRNGAIKILKHQKQEVQR